MDKEDALRVYQKIDAIEQILAGISVKLETKDHECSRQQEMIDELRKRVNVLEQAQAKSMGGVTTALAMVTSLVSVGAFVVTLFKQ